MPSRKRGKKVSRAPPKKRSPPKKRAPPKKRSPVRRQPPRAARRDREPPGPKLSAFRDDYKEINVPDVIDESIYVPYKTALVPRNISHNRIINYILDNIKTIEGPVSFTLLKPTAKLTTILRRPPPVILFLGDYHIGNKPCEAKCRTRQQCFSIAAKNKFSFLSLMDLKIAPDVVTDVFFEWWLPETERLKRDLKLGEKPIWNRPNGSAIYEDLKELWPCMKYEKNRSIKYPFGCKMKHTRVHMVDPRNLAGNFVYKYVEFIPHFIYDYSPEFFKKTVATSFPGYDWKEIFALILKRIELGFVGFFNQYFRKHPFFRQHSVVYKQIKALPEPLIRDIFANFTNLFGTITDFPHPEIVDEFWKIRRRQKQPSSSTLFKDLYMAIEKVNNDRELQHLSEIIPRDYNWLSFVSILDIYFLGRSLKSPVDGLPSQLSILYAGDNHIKNLNTFLLHSGWYECVAHNTIRTPLFDGKESKCVPIRKHDNPHNYVL